jgi:isopenicillin-N N-acyltransferase-like protein
VESVTSFAPRPGMPVLLAGSPAARGQGQAVACPDAVPAVRVAVRRRLEAGRDLLARPAIRRHLDRQWDFALRHDAEGIAELGGVAGGFGLDPRALFDYLHLGQLTGVPDAPGPDDGCTAWAAAHPVLGALVAKNRDFRGEHQGLQRVFLHRDPAWGGRSMLCVGSLGSPGAYSSGVNSDGFALADTQVVTTDQGIGLLRYFMMTRLLARCARVEEALDALRGVRQAGGGCLVMADATGATAAVEIGHRALEVERGAASVARTNHFLSPALAGSEVLPPDSPALAGSLGRLARVRRWLETRAAPPAAAEAAALMGAHEAGGEALCRHPAGDESRTLSCSIFACAPAGLTFSDGPPCSAPWFAFSCAMMLDGAGGGVRDGADR